LVVHENDQIMEKADAHDNVPGFSVLEVMP